MTAFKGSRRVRTRALLAGATAATLVVGVVGPAQSQEPIRGTGTSTLSLIPADLDVSGLPAPIAASLGTLVAEATNVSGGLAALSLDGTGAAGQTAPAFAVSSADGDKAGNETREAGAGRIGAVLRLLDYAVTATEDSATSRLAGAGGELTTPLGLGATAEAQELLAAVTANDATGALALDLSGLQIGLDDLLPADVLNALPLSVLLDLLDGLGIPLPTDLRNQVRDLQALPGTLTQATKAANDLKGLQSQIAALLAQLPNLSGAQKAVTDAQATVNQLTSQISTITSQVTGLTGQIDSLTQQRSALNPILDMLQINQLTAQIDQLTGERTTLQGQVTTLTSQLTSAQGLLTQAQKALDDLLSQVGTLNPDLAALLARLADLEALLNRLLGQLTGVLDGLDLPDLRLDLLDLLKGTSLLDLGDLGIDLSAVADGTGSEGTATCSASGLEVLGTAVPTPSCADVAGALDRLDSALRDGLAALPVSGALPAVDVGGLDVTSSGVRQAVDGTSEAFARVDALTVGVSPARLTAVTDSLLPQLDGLIGQLTGALGGLDLALLDRLPTLPGISAAGTDDVSASAVQLPAGLDASLGQLKGVLGTLPTGGALAGLSTVGLDAVLGAVDVTSTFTAAGAPTAPGTPTTPGTPGSPAAPGTPGTPGAPGQLPRTGAEFHLLLMAALAALAAGATTVGVGQAFAGGVHRAARRSG